MNLPNKLTMMRVIMVPFFMVFAAMSHMGTPKFNATYALIAGILFAVASFTDFLDGYLARKNHLVTDFGKFMDPLADKMLTTAAIIYMVVDGVCSPVVLAIIMFREFAVAGVRMIAAESGTVIAANMWGKVKTVLQMVTIIFYYFAAALAGPTDVGARPGGRRWGYQLYHPGAVLGRCCRYRTFRLHLPVAESFLLYAGKMMLPPCNRLSGRL